MPTKKGKKVLVQTRYYGSMETIRVDADQFVRMPDVFNGKEPRPGSWAVRARVVKAEQEKGSPPAEPHRLVLSIEVEGEDRKIAEWHKACEKKFGLNTSEHISKEMGRSYMRRSSGQA